MPDSKKGYVLTCGCLSPKIIQHLHITANEAKVQQ